MRKDHKRKIAYEILIFFGTLLLLSLVLRFWPLVLLFVIGLFAAALRMLFLWHKDVQIIPPAAPPAPEPNEMPPPKTEHEILQYAFALIQTRISDEVKVHYPSARWVWESPNAQKSIAEGFPVAILLNHAGGYRRARVNIHNLQYQGLVFESTEPTESPAEPADAETNLKPGVLAENEPVEQSKEPAALVNYERLAFEWLDEHLLALMALCNEAQAKKAGYLLIPSSDLPMRESWPDIQKQLLIAHYRGCSDAPY